MLDIFFLTIATNNYLEKRSRKKAFSGVNPEEINLKEGKTEGRGDKLFKVAVDKEVKQYKYFVLVFLFFLILRFVFELNYSRDIKHMTLGLKGDFAQVTYVDNLQRNIVLVGSHMFMFFFPVWASVSVGINYLNQLDEDFHRKEFKNIQNTFNSALLVPSGYGRYVRWAPDVMMEFSLLSQYKSNCLHDKDFISCMFVLKFENINKEPETFEREALEMKSYVSSQEQVCLLYNAIGGNYKKHKRL